MSAKMSADEIIASIIARVDEAVKLEKDQYREILAKSN